MLNPLLLPIQPILCVPFTSLQSMFQGSPASIAHLSNRPVHILYLLPD
jgi:hypothetical protein